MALSVPEIDINPLIYYYYHSFKCTFSRCGECQDVWQEVGTPAGEWWPLWDKADVIADDTALVADSKKKLSRPMSEFDKSMQMNFKLLVNVGKGKVMRCTGV